jgi:hypothetical protein
MSEAEAGLLPGALSTRCHAPELPSGSGAPPDQLVAPLHLRVSRTRERKVTLAQARGWPQLQPRHRTAAGADTSLADATWCRRVAPASGACSYHWCRASPAALKEAWPSMRSRAALTTHQLLICEVPLQQLVGKAAAPAAAASVCSTAVLACSCLRLGFGGAAARACGQQACRMGRGHGAPVHGVRLRAAAAARPSAHLGVGDAHGHGQRQRQGHRSQCSPAEPPGHSGAAGGLLSPKAVPTPVIAKHHLRSEFEEYI